MDAKAREDKERLVDWVVELLQQYMKKMVAQRSKKPRKKDPAAATTKREDVVFTKTGSNLDEVAEVISLPQFNAKTANNAINSDRDIVIDAVVIQQLHMLVTKIAATYNDNPFHNFSHACHVTMAVHKFLQRIVAPDLDLEAIARAKKNSGVFASELHDYTHGINSDPVTLCAIIFSALIHDSDHRGISNTQLGVEDADMATRYEGKSLAEQNSLDLCWDMLMSEDFLELRKCLFADKSELHRFRQVVVNVVLGKCRRVFKMAGQQLNY